MYMPWWELLWVFVAGFFNSIMDDLDFQLPHNNGWWSLKEDGSMKDAWHWTKFLMIASFVMAFCGEFQPWYIYAQGFMWSGIVWSLSHGLFYTRIFKKSHK